MHIRQVAMTEHSRDRIISLQQHDIRRQPTHVLLQAFPLGRREFVCTDQADADGFGVKSARMRAHLVEVTAGGDRAIGVDHEVIADGGKTRVLPLPEFSRTLESALAMPAVDLLNGKMLAVRGGRAMDDDAFDLSSHAAMMAEDKRGNKEEAGPPVGFGRMKLAG